MTVSIKKKNSEIASELMEKLGVKNRMQIPRITKVVVNAGIGKFTKDKNQIDEVKESLRLITGQAPLLTKAKKSISGFKVREGMEVGMKVTLRGTRMWNFIERLVDAAIPRIKDFQGINIKNIDEKGNLNIGFKEQIVFPEIIPEQVKNTFGFQVTIIVAAKDKKEGRELFKALGFPIKND